MMDKKSLLELRGKMKKRKPTFARKDSNKKKRIEDDVWRRPRGVDNKQRLKRKGHKKNPSSGYRSPVAVRGLHKSGLVPVVVTTPTMLAKLTKEHGIIIASTLGGKKRRQVIEFAKKQGFTIVNLNADKELSRIDTQMNERRKLKAQKVAKPTDEPEPKKEEPELSEEEKKKIEKEEKDKVLTGKKA